MKFDTEVFKKAGLNKSDIARIFGVSRTTVHNWYSNKTVHVLIEDRVTQVTNAVRKAVHENKLPVAVRDSETREKEISGVIKPYL